MPLFYSMTTSPLLYQFLSFSFNFFSIFQTMPSPNSSSLLLFPMFILEVYNGRMAEQHRLKPNVLVFLGLDIGGTQTKAGNTNNFTAKENLDCIIHRAMHKPHCLTNKAATTFSLLWLRFWMTWGLSRLVQVYHRWWGPWINLLHLFSWVVRLGKSALISTHRQRPAPSSLPFFGPLQLDGSR